MGKLTRRMESDVKSLHAFYRYGVLHRCVRLRWRFIDEVFPVDWALPGEPHLHEILQRAKEAAAPVDIVIGSAPGWADPWSRARRGSVLEVEPWQVTVALDGEVWRLDRRDIQALRVLGGAECRRDCRHLHARARAPCGSNPRAASPFTAAPGRGVDRGVPSLDARGIGERGSCRSGRPAFQLCSVRTPPAHRRRGGPAGASWRIATSGSSIPAPRHPRRNRFANLKQRSRPNPSHHEIPRGRRRSFPWALTSRIALSVRTSRTQAAFFACSSPKWRYAVGRPGSPSIGSRCSGVIGAVLIFEYLGPVSSLHARQSSSLRAGDQPIQPSGHGATWTKH